MDANSLCLPVCLSKEQNGVEVVVIFLIIH